MTHFYSPSTKGFYTDNFQQRYQVSDSWPDDLHPLDEDQYQAFLNGVNSGSTIEEVGGVLTLVAPSDQDVLDQLRQLALDRIETDFKRSVAQGVVCSVGDNIYAMDTNWDDPVQLIGGIDLMAAAGQTTITLIDFHGDPHPGVSLDDARSVATQMGVNYQTLLQQRATLQAKIKAVQLDTTLAAAKAVIDTITWQ